MKNIFTNTESAIFSIIESAQIHSTASENGDYKKANKNYEIIQKAVEFIIDNNQIDSLKNLLNHNEISVKIASASYLLKYFEKESLEVLEKIVTDSILFKSFEAKMILQEWRNGNLK